MDPVTSSVLASTLSKAGQKAVDLSKVFVQELNKEESRIRLFFHNLYEKPLSWLFTLLFAPIIMVVAIAKNFKNMFRGLNKFQKIRTFLLLIGFCLGGISFWLAGAFLGSVAGFLLLKNIFGWITACGFFLGVSVSVTLTTIFQILIFNVMCFIFLKLTKESVIRTVYDEFMGVEARGTSQKSIEYERRKGSGLHS